MPLDKRPNTLLILTDQQRWDTLGCYGAPVCQTPHIDALAARGVRFTSAYTGAIACSPSRASLFTGLYPHQHSVLNNNLVMDEVPNLASELGRAGYSLAYAGKWHVDHARLPSDHGFRGLDFPDYGYPNSDGTIDRLYYHLGRVVDGVPSSTPHYADYVRRRGLEPPKVLNAHYGDSPAPNRKRHEMYALQSGDIESSFEAMVAEEARRLLRELQSDRERDDTPFFLWVNFWGPHTPCFVPEPYYSMYDPAQIPQEPSFPETWRNKPHRQKLGERMWGLSGDGWAGWREIVARYWGYVTMLDDLTGRILEELRALGLEEDTLVVFSSDHGDMMGAHGLIEKGPYAYDESFRIPLVAACPGGEALGSVNDEFVYLHDLFQTFVDCAGGEPPEGTDGVSLLPRIRGEHTPIGRESVYGYSAHGLRHPLRMVRTRTHKLVLTPSEMGETLDLVNDPWELFELYDLASDPHEMRNLIGLPEARAAQKDLMELLRRHMVRLEDPFLDYFERVRGAHWPESL